MSDQVLDGIRDLLPALRERAADAERERMVPTQSIKEIAETGFYRLLQPKRFGGIESTLRPFYTGVKMLASACGSTGRVSTVLGSHAWHLATYPERAQEEFWGTDPDAVLCSAYAPMGRATAVDGGYRLSGRWSFSSGSAYAAGCLVGTLIIGDDGAPADYVSMLVPAADFTIDDVWHTMGLRGTGSNDIVVDDVFVPEHRVLSFNDSFNCDTPGSTVNTNPMYRLPLFSVMTTTIASPLIGMAEGAYSAHVEHQRGRVRVYEGTNVKDDPFSKLRVARAASEIDASWLQMMRNIEDVEAAARNGAIPMELRATLRRDQARAAERAIDAVDRVFESSGASAIATSDPIQRFWRDAHAARVHVANDPESALKLYGDIEFGATVDKGML